MVRNRASPGFTGPEVLRLPQPQLIIRMRITRLTVLGAMLLVVGCGGPLPTTGAATGTPAAIAQGRPFATPGTDLTVYTGLPDNQSVPLEARLYAPDGHRLTEIVEDVTMDSRFDPEPLATSSPVP